MIKSFQQPFKGLLSFKKYLEALFIINNKKLSDTGFKIDIRALQNNTDRELYQKAKLRD